jgi:hypothetical protein
MFQRIMSWRVSNLKFSRHACVNTTPPEMITLSWLHFY